MKHLDGLLRLVDNELGSIASAGKFRSREELENAYKLIDIAKDIYCIWCYEDGLGDGGYSETYYSRDDGTSYRGRSYDDYRVEPGRDMRSYRRSMNYSRDDAKDEIVDKLRDMLKDTPDESKRKAIQRMITTMENS